VTFAHRADVDAGLVAERLAALADDTGLTLDELREMWVAQTSEQIAMALTAMAAGEMSDAVRCVHTAAGTAGMCGATSLARHLSTVERLAADGRGDEARAALGVAQEDFLRLTLTLEKGLGN
jgi:HPt (histidine-containing phosphotransfer) domain-containing protein